VTQSSNRDAHRFLRGKGFRLCAPRSGAKVSYEGPLPFRGKSVPIRLDIIDWDFKSRPEVRLLERPEALGGFRPHLGIGATLCYLDRESVFMDPYDPVGVVGRCLLEAESTLEEVAGDKRRIDLRGEFLVNWSALVQFPLMLWTEAEEGKRMLSFLNVDFPHREGLCVITDSVERTSSCLSKTGAKPGDAFEGSAVEFLTQEAPAIDPDSWPPRNLRDVLQWLDGWDTDLRRAFLGRLESLWSKDKTLLVALFCTPAGRFGFDFSIKYTNPAEKARLAKRAGDRRQRIITMNPQIRRFVVSDMSPAFLHGRNQPNRETLAGRNISIVGCGTVGGYLATFLARLGAGYGGGTLKIYETQSLMPENLGRHVLSMHDLFRNKADGVVDMLAREFPYIKARARKVDATEATDLFDGGLIIDATGLSAVSIAINRELISRLKKGEFSSAVLYSWVEGPGDAVRCLLVDSLKFMCHECLFNRQEGQPPRDRMPVSTREEAAGREYPGGCGSYMPFAVSAAATAAALTLDLARDWARGNPHPRLRSRRLDLKNTQGREDTSPKPLDACPACRPK
jgi:hypothetical protein